LELEDLEKKLKSTSGELVEIAQLIIRLELVLRSLKEAAMGSESLAELSGLLEAAGRKWGETDTIAKVIMALMKLQYIQGRVDQMREDKEQGLEPRQESMRELSSKLDDAVRDLKVLSDVKSRMESMIEKAEEALAKIRR